MRKGWVAAVLSLAVAAPAYAFRCKVSKDYEYISLYWPTRSIRYGLLPQNSEAQGRALDVAFSAWGAPPCTDLSFENIGVIGSDDDDTPRMVFVEENWGFDEEEEAERSDRAVAITLTRYGLENGMIRTAMIEVNAERFQFLDVTQGCPSEPRTYDLISVLTHEVGHLLGLDHTQPELERLEPDDPTMATEVAHCDASKRTLEQDDIDGICYMYPAARPSRRCATLPEQSTPFVKSAPGCRHRHGTDGALPWAALWAVLLVAVRRRFRACSNEGHEG